MPLHLMNRNRSLCALAASAMLLCASASARAGGLPAGTSFTYQAVLKSGGNTYSGTADLLFLLFDGSGGGASQIGSTVQIDSASVVDGLMTQTLDFGALPFAGSERWLEIHVRAPAGGGGGYTILSPRQRLSAVPYALHALSAMIGGVQPAQVNFTNAANLFTGSGAGLTALNASSISTGTLGSSRLSGIYGNALTLNNIANTFAGNGAGLTALNAGNITAGTLSAERFPVPLILTGTASNVTILRGENYSSSSGSSAIEGVSFAGTGITFGVQGVCLSTSGRGVFGWATATTGDTDGVRGESDSTSGRGVSGAASSPTGLTYGVHGVTASVSGHGVYGEATALSGSNYGGRFESASTDGRGVAGVASAATGVTVGAWGQSNSTDGIGVYGWAASFSGSNYGVYGSTNSPSGYAGYFTGGRNYFGGRVGIGTPSPGAGLHVEGNTFPDAFIFLNATGAAGDAGLRLNRQGNVKWHFFNAASTDLLGIYNAAFSPVITATQSGNVGIGQVPVTNMLEVNGNASKTTAGSWLANSDRRIKRNIRPLENALGVINSLQPVGFRYTDAYRASHPSISNIEYYNVIAQDFSRVFHDYVQPSGETLADGSAILQVDTYPMLMYGVAAIKELHTETQRLQAELDATRAALAALQTKHDDLDSSHTLLQHDVADLIDEVRALRRRMDTTPPSRTEVNR